MSTQELTEEKTAPDEVLYAEETPRALGARPAPETQFLPSSGPVYPGHLVMPS